MATLIEVFERFDKVERMESYTDEDGERRIYAVGTVQGVPLLVSCSYNECKVETLDEYREVCHSKLEPVSVNRCISAVIERVRELERNAEELVRIADRLREYGFKVEKSWNGVTARKFTDSGYIEVYFPYRTDTYTLEMKIESKTPTKLVIVAAELAELLERLKV
jgi:hypothetical protein